jgi:hypothetical protein
LIGPFESARARVAGTRARPAARDAPDLVAGSKCLPRFMKAEPKEIDAKANDDAHAASN